ncbi:MAG: hypothetical protein J5858_13240 [Lentisphaeria bacterium]|nr:hypothetical protein [Lentisphaeria bacterium]
MKKCNAPLMTVSGLTLSLSTVDAQNPLGITVECSRKSHIVRVNESFDFIITAKNPGN